MQKQAQAQISVITDEALLKQVQDLSDYVAVFLARKAMVEHRKQDITNPTTLGGVKFWFQIDPRSGSTILCYDKHPTAWNVNNINTAINDMEHIFYQQEGLIFWDGR